MPYPQSVLDCNISIPLTPAVNTYEVRILFGRFVAALLFILLSIGLGLRESQAQIIVYIPNGTVQTYGTLPNEDHIFKSDGTGKVRFTGNNGEFSKSLIFDGVVAEIDYDSSFANIGEIRLNSSSVTVYKKNHNQISDTASIYLNSGILNFTYKYSYSTTENIGDVVLSGGHNKINLSPSVYYYPSK